MSHNGTRNRNPELVPSRAHSCDADVRWAGSGHGPRPRPGAQPPTPSPWAGPDTSARPGTGEARDRSEHLPGSSPERARGPSPAWQVGARKRGRVLRGKPGQPPQLSGRNRLPVPKCRLRQTLAASRARWGELPGAPLRASRDWASATPRQQRTIFSSAFPA